MLHTCHSLYHFFRLYQFVYVTHSTSLSQTLPICVPASTSLCQWLYQFRSQTLLTYVTLMSMTLPTISKTPSVCVTDSTSLCHRLYWLMLHSTNLCQWLYQPCHRFYQFITQTLLTYVALYQLMSMTLPTMSYAYWWCHDCVKTRAH